MKLQCISLRLVWEMISKTKDKPKVTKELNTSCFIACHVTFKVGKCLSRSGLMRDVKVEADWLTRARVGNWGGSGAPEPKPRLSRTYVECHNVTHSVEITPYHSFLKKTNQSTYHLTANYLHTPKMDRKISQVENWRCHCYQSWCKTLSWGVKVNEHVGVAVV